MIRLRTLKNSCPIPITQSQIYQSVYQPTHKAKAQQFLHRTQTQTHIPNHSNFTTTTTNTNTTEPSDSEPYTNGQKFKTQSQTTQNVITTATATLSNSNSTAQISGSNSNSKLSNILSQYSNKKPSPGTLQQMIAMSNPKHRLSVGPHLLNELLIRITHRYLDFQNLPQPLLNQPTVQNVSNLYASYLQTLHSLKLQQHSNDFNNLNPNLNANLNLNSNGQRTDDVNDIETPLGNRHFIQILTEFKAKDSSTLPYIALGIRNLQKQNVNSDNSNNVVDNRLATMLDDLFTARLSIRMLIAQYCEASGAGSGVIERGIRVADVCEAAARSATQMCSQNLGTCPKFVIEGNTELKIPFVRSFLEHIVVELLKNSARATVEKSRDRNRGGNGKLPDVSIVVAGGKEDCVIKVSDEGGGIPRSGLSKIWSYQYTTSDKYVELGSANVGNAKGGEKDTKFLFREGFFGGGYGLPIARVFAKYFGGDLSIISTEGWGTDAYVYLNRVESSAVEVLPD